MKKLKPRNITIKIKNCRQEFFCDRLVVLGDSMTRGSETADHIHPLYKFKKKWNSVTWNNAIRSKPEYLEITKKIHQEEVGFSWPNQLAKILKLPVINYAIGGNALEKICIDLFLKQVDITSNDLVLIGLPPPGRYVHFEPEKIGVINAGYMQAIWPKEGILDLKTMLNFYSDDKITWDYLAQLTMLYNFKSFSHKKLFCVPQWGLIEDWAESDKIKLSTSIKNPMIDAISDIYKSDLMLISGWHLSNGDYPFCRCEHGHPDKGTHLRIASKLHKYIF